jgi:hypothetical protein
MSFDMIFLSASVKATIHLDNGEDVPWGICESFNLWERGAIGHSNIVKIMNAEDHISAYREVINEIGNFDDYPPMVIYDPDDESIDFEFEVDGNEVKQIIVGASVKADNRTVGQKKLEEFDQWLQEHRGWKLNWSCW